jgi:hypothetical protein
MEKELKNTVGQESRISDYKNICRVNKSLKVNIATLFEV